MTYKLLVGGYTDNGLRVLTFDPSKEDSNDKILLQETTVSAGSSPSWIVQHPNNQSLVFATNEVEDGRILGIQLSGTNDATADKITGELVANVSSGGTYPAHLLILKDSIVAGNYMGGSILDIPYSTAESLSLTDTSVEKKVGSFVQFSGTGPNADRQESSHPHEVYLYNDELFIPDLGADKTWRLTKGSNGWEVKGSIDYVPGAGPRHILIHDGIIYTVLELTSELSLHKYATLPETPTHIATVSTFSTGKPADPKMLAAEILLSPNKKFIYVSNRNDPSSEGDTIAVYSVPSSNESSKLIREIRTGVTHARGMNFSKDGKYLAVAGSHTSSVRIFEVLQESPDGEVKGVANIQGLEKPTAVIWI